jgi:hypothetical protein
MTETLGIVLDCGLRISGCGIKSKIRSPNSEIELGGSPRPFFQSADSFSQNHCLLEIPLLQELLSFDSQLPHLLFQLGHT